MIAIPDIDDFLVVVGAEPVKDPVESLFLELASLGKALVADVGNRKKLTDVDTGELLEGFRVGDDVYPSPHEQVAEHRA